MSYIPDDIKINSLSQDLVLSVLMNDNQGKYFTLYKQYIFSSFLNFEKKTNLKRRNITI